MKVKNILGISLVSVSLWACTTNPITGRSSLHLANDQQIDAMALQEYKQTLQTAKVINGTASANQVKTVGNRIKNAAIKYYTDLGLQANLANYQWEFNLLQDPQLNAWCMPGGKVAVYSGILPVTRDATGLAVVLGHEISHALAGHGNERISQAMIAQYGGAILGSTISNQQVAAIFAKAYPVGAQVGLLAYGRKQELEADEMGLYLMAMAGYDPQQAPIFWQRMESAAGDGQRPPEFLSTHPAPENRRADLLNDMPRALQYYRAAGGK
ncbi:M48 family metallopeptidase [Halpernia sp. GG3]